MSDPWVTPCRSCGQAGNNFDLRHHPDAPFGLVRYCVPCHGEQHAEWQAENRAMSSIYEARYQRRIAGQPCAFDGCDRQRRGRFCVAHAKQFQRLGLGGMKPLQPYRGERGPNRRTG